jgi:hypothetical protein
MLLDLHSLTLVVAVVGVFSIVVILIVQRRLGRLQMRHQLLEVSGGELKSRLIGKHQVIQRPSDDSPVARLELDCARFFCVELIEGPGRKLLRARFALSGGVELRDKLRSVK